MGKWAHIADAEEPTPEPVTDFPEACPKCPKCPESLKPSLIKAGADDSGHFGHFGQGVAVSESLPPDWSEGIARLLFMPCPPNVPAPRWTELLDVTRKLAASPWLHKAAALGWDAVDLWGCGIRAPAARVDLQGLAWLLRGCRIMAMSDATCSLRAGDAPQTFYRRRQFSGEVTLAWRLSSPEAERGVFDDGDWEGGNDAA